MTAPLEVFRELGDATRLQVFLVLLRGRRNVSQIVLELGLSQPQVSYHLKKLREAGLAVEERDGRWVYYEANWETGDPHVRELLDLTARWAELAPPSAGPSVRPPARTPVRPSRPAEKPPPAGPSDDNEGRPIIERPKRADNDLDDFLL